MLEQLDQINRHNPNNLLNSKNKLPLKHKLKLNNSQQQVKVEVTIELVAYIKD